MTQPSTHTQAVSSNSQASKALHPIIGELFKKRGFDANDVSEFLSWDLKELPDLSKMKDLKKASTRLLLAIEEKQKIGVYGDYDVDGTTSCALLYLFLKMLDVADDKIELIQPSRFVEGYGIHPPSIDSALEKDIAVLITVDCGITNGEAAEYAKLRGLDLIITDHHTDALPELPEAFAVVNPNRRDEDSDSLLGPMAGVGVAFALALQIKKDLEFAGGTCPSLYPLLQFVAIGTICDLAKLTPVNLKLVRHGLRQLAGTKYEGIRTFFSPEEQKRGVVLAEKLSFQIGPMINSKGRLDHPEKALKLLIADNHEDAFDCFSHLEISNRERKYIQGIVAKSAREQVRKNIDGEMFINIVYDSEWHEGVIGIVASRLVEEFKVPALVFTDSEEEGVIKCSARSAGELDLFSLLNDQKDLFIKFGGHKAAAGLSMKKENLPELRTRLKNALVNVPAIARTRIDNYDLEIKPEAINPAFVRSLDLLEPYGMHNSKPVFKMKGFKIASFDVLKEVHVRWNLVSVTDPRVKLKGISFNYLGKWGLTHPEDLYALKLKNPEEELVAYFTLGLNYFRGNEHIQLMIDKIESGF